MHLAPTSISKFKNCWNSLHNSIALPMESWDKAVGSNAKVVCTGGAKNDDIRIRRPSDNLTLFDEIKWDFYHLETFPHHVDLTWASLEQSKFVEWGPFPKLASARIEVMYDVCVLYLCRIFIVKFYWKVVL